MQQYYHRDNLRADLISKGLKLLDEEGYEGFSLRKVAKACNVSHTAPYRHFKKKDELILAIGAEAMSKFGQALQQAVDRYPDDTRSQLKEMGCAYVKFFMENPEYLRLIFLSDIVKKINTSEMKPENLCITSQGCDNHPFGILYKTVESYIKGEKETVDNPIDREALVLYCWGLVHGISILIAKKDFPYNGDYMDLVRKILWDDNIL